MAPSLRSLVSLLAISQAVTAASWNTTCTSPSQRKAWNNMTTTEKTAYIDAELCLMARPAQAGIEGAQNRWDELDWAHIVQSNIIHNVGGFLPWHRYFMRVHEYLLQSECGYEGGQPYWNEVLDMDDLAGSVVFDPDTGFGGEGSDCVTDGPFVNLTLHMNSSGTSEDYCLTRSFNSNGFQSGVQANLDECFNMTTYEDAFDCYQVNPHTAGHSAVGGTMLDVVGSPGEPLFFLHHSNLDRLWWQWQQANLTTRLTEMGGRNVPLASYLEQNGMESPSSSVLDYDGDEGNVTTLNHNLWMVGIMPNATIREVMDLGGDLVCAEYV
ncbi:amino acid transporter [Ilyonectria robusta]|uniref:amino acid transporter n=1 Tax=Ilyonectria robusta TaxID=1079257 RepID=UPI001E8DE3E1|nr:amino acid transporter [Ilyonectria robusta]KAH8734384.1 amino acid transporter [Ilyonectria robusta]